MRNLLKEHVLRKREHRKAVQRSLRLVNKYTVDRKDLR